MEFSYEDPPKRGKRFEGVKVTKGKGKGKPRKERELPVFQPKRPAPGESSQARLTRLQQETPSCDVCGSSRVVYRRTLTGKDTWRCGLHIGSTVAVPSSEQRALETYQNALVSGVLDEANLVWYNDLDDLRLGRAQEKE